MAKLIQQMDENQPKTRSELLLRCLLLAHKRGTVLYWNDQLPNKILSTIN